MIKKIVGYERLSSREQAFNSPAREQQKARLIAAGATEIFEDIESGRKDDRPQLKILMTKVANQEVDEVVITRIDRLARSLLKLRECITIFLESGVNLKALDQHIDLHTSHGMLTLNILGAVAEMEADMTSDRVNHGKQHRRNKKAACESIPWGYRVVNDKYQLDTQPILCLLEDRPSQNVSAQSSHSSKKKLQNPESHRENQEEFPGRSRAQIAREMIELILEKRSIPVCLKMTYNKYGFKKSEPRNRVSSVNFSWSRTGFSQWLKNQVLCGHTVYNKSKMIAKKRKNNPPEDWIVLLNTHPDQRLMTDEEYQDIQEINAANRKLVGENFKRPLASTKRGKYSYQIGLIYCRECGSRCTSKTSKSKGKTYSYFACRYSGMGCGNRQSAEKQKIEDSLLKFLVQTSQLLYSKQVDQRKVEFHKSSRLLELEAQLKAAESFPGFNINNEKLKNEIRQQITDEINGSRSLNNQTVEQIIHAGHNLSFWHTLSNEEKVAVYHRIVDKIFINNGEVDSILLKSQPQLIKK